jgi:Domain of unknown function (DUF4276)
VSVKLYVEGGGDGQLLDTLFRQGWKQFFEAAGLAGKMPGVVRGQGRTQTLDLFATAVVHPRGGTLPMLLVDSEEAVEEGHSVWQHLETCHGWKRPPCAADDQAFLMVQVMETWFLADRDLLRRYLFTAFPPGLRDGRRLVGTPGRDLFFLGRHGLISFRHAYFRRSPSREL